MKKQLLFAFLLFAVVGAKAQRLYFDKTIDSVLVTKDVVYGSNYVFDILKGQLGLTKEDQTLDIYQPYNDVNPDRPLLIWAHGGSFLGGTKEDKDIVYFCNEYAKRGFLCVSINYRIGYELPLDSTKAVRTVFRALQDGRAAIRYMRSKSDSLGFNKNKVFFGGTSAGAFVAMNVGFLNLPEEVPSYVDTTGHNDILNTDPQIGIDGIEGLTNTIQESSEIQGIIGYCGATKVTSWMDDQYSRNIPMIMMHGTRDSTVPYATRIIYLNDLTPIPPQLPLPIVQVQGSYDVDKHADEAGYLSRFYTWYGADHVPYINYDDNGNGAAYMDTVMRFTAKHIYEDFLGLGEVDGIEENDPPCDFNNGIEDPCISGIAEAKNNPFQLYPNPASDGFAVKNVTGEFEVLVIDQMGRTVINKKGNMELYIPTLSLPTGLFMVHVKCASGLYTEKLILE